MRSSTLLVPFGLPPTELTKDLLAGLHLPALAELLARARPLEPQNLVGIPAMLPHERLLSGVSTDTSPAIAHGLMQAFGLSRSEGYYFLVQPVHWHIARDHLVLSDVPSLEISSNESLALFEIASALAQEAGHELLFGDSRHWFLRADAWSELRTTTPEAACGHNIDLWQASGERAREWRRLHNEIQMAWHEHPVNQTREIRGSAPINALWLWGGSTLEAASLVAKPYLHHLLEGAETTHATGSLSEIAMRLGSGNPSSLPSVSPTDMPDLELKLDTRLRASALAGDWATWRIGLQALEIEQFAPALTALRSGARQQVTLHFTDSSRLRSWQISRSGLRKFWLRPSLSRLGA